MRILGSWEFQTARQLHPLSAASVLQRLKIDKFGESHVSLVVLVIGQQPRR